MTETDREATERIVLRWTQEADSDFGQLWEVVGTIKRGTKKQAIDALAKGEPGKYRSVPLRSWRGGLEIVLPEKPKPESRLFD